jgi:V/A-type H+-transporting ATPase subunit D
MRIKVNPTRIELLRLRRRVELARRGHKLLKDKLDGLMQRFFKLRQAYLSLRQELDPQLIRIFFKSVMASAQTPPPALAVEESAQVELETILINIMGVKIPSYQLKVEGRPGFAPLLATVELYEARSGFIKILPELIRLAAASRSLTLIAAQITETRRRVNALEFVLIPELMRNLTHIRMQLAERERSAQVVLLKIKGGPDAPVGIPQHIRSI